MKHILSILLFFFSLSIAAQDIAPQIEDSIMDTLQTTKKKKKRRKRQVGISEFFRLLPTIMTSLCNSGFCLIYTATVTAGFIPTTITVSMLRHRIF